MQINLIKSIKRRWERNNSYVFVLHIFFMLFQRSNFLIQSFDGYVFIK